MNDGSDPLSLLGLAMRAGGVAAGVEATRQAIRSGEAGLVLVAGDGAPGQTEKVRRTLAGSGVPHLETESAEAMGAAVGRPPLTAVAVTDASLAGALRRALGGGVREFSATVEK